MPQKPWLPQPDFKTPPFVELLLFLEKNPKNTSERNISFYIDKPPKMVSASLTYCVERELISKSINPKDARMRVYKLTEKGFRVLGLFRQLEKELDFGEAITY